MKKSHSSILSVLFILAFLGFVFFTMMPQWPSDDDAPLAEFSTQRALEQVKNISQKPHFVGSENLVYIFLTPVRYCIYWYS